MLIGGVERNSKNFSTYVRLIGAFQELCVNKKRSAGQYYGSQNINQVVFQVNPVQNKFTICQKPTNLALIINSNKFEK